MKLERYDAIVGRVRDRCGLGSRDAAVAVLGAVLTTLGERVLASQAHPLAAQLPPELGSFLERTDGGATRFGLDELLRRVATREGVSVDVALRHVRAVLGVIGEASAPAALDGIVRALSGEERAALFENEATATAVR